MRTIRQSTPDVVYTLVGSEISLARRFLHAVHQRQQELGGLFVDLQRFRFDEDGCETALFACRSVSLFAAVSVVSLENCSAFVAAAKTRFDVTALEAYLSDPVPGRTLVIHVPDKLDERKKLTKLAKKHTVIDCHPPGEEAATEILHEMAREFGVDVARTAVAELWRRCQSVSLAETELQKVWTYTGGRTIQAEDVAVLVPAPADDNIFAWIDAVVTGHAQQAFSVLRDIRISGHDPFSLLALLARQIRLMWFARVLSERGRSQQEIATAAGAHPYAVKVAMKQSQRLTPTVLEGLLLVLADAEYLMKSGRRDPELTLEWIVLACAAGETSGTRLRAQ